MEFRKSRSREFAAPRRSRQNSFRLRDRAVPLSQGFLPAGSSAYLGLTARRSWPFDDGTGPSAPSVTLAMLSLNTRGSAEPFEVLVVGFRGPGEATILHLLSQLIHAAQAGAVRCNRSVFRRGRVHRRIERTVGRRLRPGRDALKAIQPVFQIPTGMDTGVVAFQVARSALLSFQERPFSQGRINANPT
jgi:hypothetical protein